MMDGVIEKFESIYPCMDIKTFRFIGILNLQPVIYRNISGITIRILYDQYYTEIKVRKKLFVLGIYYGNKVIIFQVNIYSEPRTVKGKLYLNHLKLGFYKSLFYSSLNGNIRTSLNGNIRTSLNGDIPTSLEEQYSSFINELTSIEQCSEVLNSEFEFKFDDIFWIDEDAINEIQAELKQKPIDITGFRDSTGYIHECPCFYSDLHLFKPSFRFKFAD